MRTTLPTLALTLAACVAGCASPPPPPPRPPAEYRGRLESSIPTFRFCVERYASTHLGALPERDAPAAEVAAGAARSCEGVLSPAVEADRRPADPAIAARYAEARRQGEAALVPRIEDWRGGAYPWFPTGGRPRRDPPPAGMQETCDAPEYPAAAQRGGATGDTWVGIDVDATGQVTDTLVLKASGPTREHRALDRQSLQVARSCHFPPAAGVPLRRANVAYRWRLDEPAPAASAPAR